MQISMEENQGAAEYQETLKIDDENIAKNKKTIWGPLHEVIHAPCSIRWFDLYHEWLEENVITRELDFY